MVAPDVGSSLNSSTKADITEGPSDIQFSGPRNAPLIMTTRLACNVVIPLDEAKVFPFGIHSLIMNAAAGPTPQANLW